jgi:hypothetical protein
MIYTRRNIAEEQEEACQKAKQLTDLCAQFHITLDPIDWQNAGMRASVMVNMIKVADLSDLSRQDSASILRLLQMKLFERAALKTVHARPGMRAAMWSPVEVVQPQEFLSLWIITLESNERVAIAEYLRNGQRVYERFVFDGGDGHALAKLFGPAYRGEYAPGDRVTIGEHGRQCTGEIIYILYPSKAPAQSKYSSRGRHTIQGKVYTNDTSARYVVDCHDGFPHVVNQWQIINETGER